jgi:hypothetical protein
MDLHWLIATSVATFIALGIPNSLLAKGCQRKPIAPKVGIANQPRMSSVCADEKTKLDAIDASASQARQQYAEFLAHAACLSLHVEVNGIHQKNRFAGEGGTDRARAAWLLQRID